MTPTIALLLNFYYTLKHILNIVEADWIVYLLVELVEDPLCSSTFSIRSNWEFQHGGTIREINKDGGRVF